MPAAEQVLNKPLSGLDVRKIILLKLEQAMAADTRLADYVAVPSFSFRVDVAMVLAKAIESDVKITTTGGQGKVDDDPNQPAVAVTVHAEQDHLAPNEARVDAGLGVPVLTRDDRGREVEREVKYSKDKVTRAKGK